MSKNTPEGRVKKDLKLLLKNVFKAYFFMPGASPFGATGVDFLCCVQGYFVGIETKAPGEKPTPRQNFVLNEINRAGGIALWGDSAQRIASDLRYKLLEKKNVAGQAK